MQISISCWIISSGGVVTNIKIDCATQATENAFKHILASLAKPNRGEFGKYYSLQLSMIQGQIICLTLSELFSSRKFTTVIIFRSRRMMWRRFLIGRILHQSKLKFLLNLLVLFFRISLVCQQLLILIACMMV